MSQGLGGVRQTARARKQERFKALLHHLTIDLLRESYYALQRSAAPGVDGVGVEGTDEITTIRYTTLRLFGMVVTSSVPSMPLRLSLQCPFNASDSCHPPSVDVKW